MRTKRDSSIVRCAEAVKRGDAVAMVGAGNTGATMAAALARLRHGELRGAAVLVNESARGSAYAS